MASRIWIESRIWRIPLSDSIRTTSIFCLLKPTNKMRSILVIDKKTRTQKRMFLQTSHSSGTLHSHLDMSCHQWRVPMTQRWMVTLILQQPSSPHLLSSSYRLSNMGTTCFKRSVVLLHCHHLWGSGHPCHTCHGTSSLQ